VAARHGFVEQAGNVVFAVLLRKDDAHKFGVLADPAQPFGDDPVAVFFDDIGSALEIFIGQFFGSFDGLFYDA